MADGDEKIDHNDRVLVLNRVTDGPVEVMFDGKVLAWAAGQVRSIQRDEAAHYVDKSTVLWDPTQMDAPIQALVQVDEDKCPVDPTLSAAPLTAAYCKDARKYGIMDTRNLPADRLVGGAPLVNDDGEFLPNRVIRGTPRGTDTAGGMPPVNRGQVDRDLDTIPGAPA